MPENISTEESTVADNKTSTTADKPAVTTNQPAEETVSKAKFDELNGKLGTALERLDKFDKAEKSATEADNLKKGEFQKVIDEKAKEIERLSPYESRLKAELTTQWETALKVIPKDDDRFKGLFNTDDELSLQALGDNLNKFRQFKQVGVFQTKSTNENDDYTITDDDSLVVIKPDSVPQQNQIQGKSPNINPWV